MTSVYSKFKVCSGFPAGVVLLIQLLFAVPYLCAQSLDEALEPPEIARSTQPSGTIELQIGKMKQYSGLFEANGYLYTLPAQEIMMDSEVKETNQDKFAGIKGVGFFGELPAGVSYQLQYGTVETPVFKGLLRLYLKEDDIYVDDLDVEHAYMGSFQWLTPGDGLRVGGSLYNLRMNSNIEGLSEEAGGLEEYRLNSIRTSVESTEELTGNLKLTAEYIQNKSASIHKDASQKAVVGEGYLGGAVYQFSEWFELGSYYSIYYADKDDKEGKEWSAMGKKAAKAWLKDFAVTSRIDINNSWVLRLEGHLLNGLAGVENLTEEEWMKIAAEMTINF